jgi:uncharacterized MAPEG superfamily protein
MTTPLWCLFVAVLLPYVWAGVAGKTRKEQFGTLESRTPRVQQSQTLDRAARAQGAHLNSFEALAYFTPAVLVAHLTRANATHVTILAVLFVVCRILHGVFYVADVPTLRTMCFAIGLLSSLGMFVLSALA